jgi:hypothetical protein
VQAFMGEAGPYNATIAAVHGEGTDDMEYTVDWDDGDPNGRRQPAVNVSARCKDVRARSQSRRRGVRYMETLSAFESAREVLRPGAVPASMPCRGREREEVRDFLRQSLVQGGMGRGLYVSGMFRVD